jgi:hypothetical protein
MDPFHTKTHTSFKMIVLGSFEPINMYNRTITEFEKSAFLVGIDNNFGTLCYRFGIEEKRWVPVVSFPKLKTNCFSDVVSMSVSRHFDSLVVLTETCFFKYNIKTRKTVNLPLVDKKLKECFNASIVRNDLLIAYSSSGNIFKFDFKLKEWSQLFIKGKIILKRGNQAHCYDEDSSKWVILL